MSYLEAHPIVTQVIQPKNVKAMTEEGSEAEVEYHLDISFKVMEKNHEIKIKLYNTNCRVHVQHAGKVECIEQEHLQNNCPPKFFAENVIIPFCEKAYDSIKDKDIAFVNHLKEEINRLMKEGVNNKVSKKKVPTKTNIREKCAALKCKHKNVVLTNNDGRFGKCGKCDRFEHYDCVNVNSFVIESIQKGFTNYYCTNCLMNNPALGLEIILEIEDESPIGQIQVIPDDTEVMVSELV